MNHFKKNKSIIPLMIIMLIFPCVFFSCIPSREFLLKQNKAHGIDNLHIRVLLKKTGSRVLVSSANRMKITDRKTGSIIYDGEGKDISFYPEKIDGPICLESWGSLSVDNEIYRGMIEIHNVLGNIYVINVLKISEYLYGVVPCEISSTWESEALKAQAVAARSYTYYHLINNNKKTLFDLDCTSNFQVYKGFSAEKDATNRAVDDTSGKIASSSGKPILAFFHSTCGGKTADDSVWNGQGLEYLTPVKCEYCGKSPYFTWEERISLYEIREYIGKKYMGMGEITGITFNRYEGRVVSASIRHKNGIVKLSGNELRLLFPDKKIKSMYFNATKTKDGLILNGHGWGHGVGMCQWGAKGMAAKGANYKDILKYYYKGISITDAGQKDYAGR